MTRLLVALGFGALLWLLYRLGARLMCHEPLPGARVQLTRARRMRP